MLPQAHSHVAHFEFSSLPSPNAPPSVLRPTAHRGARIAGAQGGRDAARRRGEREGRRERDVVSRSHGPQDTLPSARSHWAGTLAPGESRAEAHAASPWTERAEPKHTPGQRAINSATQRQQSHARTWWKRAASGRSKYDVIAVCANCAEGMGDAWNDGSVWCSRSG
jgi:hypothetical protein